MSVKITVIVDNKETEGLKGEWGLSMMIERGEQRILLDVGASELFADNLKKLGFAIDSIDCAVLSHAHYDHANGMARFFADNAEASFYLREGAAENCYKKLCFFKKYIGLPHRILSDYKDRIVFASGDYELYPGIWLIPHKTPGLKALGRRESMCRKTRHGWQNDDFSHEQSLVLETEKGLLILNSCSHGGAANIIREVAETFPDKKVYGLIGGFHLFNKTEAEVRKLAEQIRQTGISYVCTGHCTMERAYAILKEELGDSLHQLHTGLVMEF